jgi:hypothetical protein
MASKEEISGLALSFPEGYQVTELTESHPDFKSHEDRMVEHAPDFLGHWRIAGPKGKLDIFFQEVELNIHGNKRKMLGWLMLPSRGVATPKGLREKGEVFETAEEMRDRVFELLEN